jgi:hypothetical protein
MNQSDVRKALECCASQVDNPCVDCPCFNGECIAHTPYVLEYIDRLEAENKRLREMVGEAK